MEKQTKFDYYLTIGEESLNYNLLSLNHEEGIVDRMKRFIEENDYDIKAFDFILIVIENGKIEHGMKKSEKELVGFAIANCGNYLNNISEKERFIYNGLQHDFEILNNEFENGK